MKRRNQKKKLKMKQMLKMMKQKQMEQTRQTKTAVQGKKNGEWLKVSGQQNEWGMWWQRQLACVRVSSQRKDHMKKHWMNKEMMKMMKLMLMMRRKMKKMMTMNHLYLTAEEMSK